jgi:hypothetical protein
MTGAEVLIKKGNSIVLGKVRFDGYDVKDFFKGKKIFNIDHLELWKKYLEFRRKDFSDVCLKSEITTEYDNGFCNVFVKEPVIIDIDEFNSVVKHIESLIESSNPEDGYLCGYTDYMVLVDYDKKKVTFF